jgi:hydroxyacylglutathione hydrolase
MQVLHYFVPNSLRNFNTIVYCEKQNLGFVVDPFDAELAAQKAQSIGIELKGIIHTHFHFDHVKGDKELSEKLNIPILELGDGDSLKVGDSELKVLGTPGHTMDHVSFLGETTEGTPFIICGDTLFNCGVGNCKNGGDPKVLYETVISLLNILADNTMMYCSHDYLLTNLNFAKSIDKNNSTIQKWIDKREAMDLDNEFIFTTIGEEKTFNPFFKVQSETEFVKLRKLRDIW